MPIRVLVVDDSAFMRRIVGDAVASQPDMQLAGVARNGLDALLQVEQLQPDVLTLDIEMPEMDGLAALRHLMVRYPRPVVMLSSATQAGALATMRALSIGAVDFVAKPSGTVSVDFHRVRDELLGKIRLAAGARVRRTSPEPRPTVAPVKPTLSGCDFERIVVIGASTGGPRALATVLPGLPNDGRTAYVLVQHMPAGFTRSLAERLDGTSQLSIKEAAPGDHLTAGMALLAPGNSHLRLTSHGIAQLDNQAPRVHGVRPSIDVTLGSVAEHFGSRATAVILTGMGQDGADGAVAIRAAGGYVLAEDESTCVVYGMPRAVAERGAADRVVALDSMAEAIVVARGRAVASRPAVRG